MPTSRSSRAGSLLRRTAVGLAGALALSVTAQLGIGAAGGGAWAAAHQQLRSADTSSLAAEGVTPKAPPGPGPVVRDLPASAETNHGLPKGERPPVVPPATRAEGRAQKLSRTEWSKVRKPKPVAPLITEKRAAAAAAGAQSLVLRPGFTIGDTSLVLYFDAASPGVSDWASWHATVYDPETGTAQESAPQAGTDPPVCGAPRTYCRSFGAAEGWSLTDGHDYFVTLTVTLDDGTQVTSDPSARAKARATADPPALPADQTVGCSCGNALTPTTFGQALRGHNVNTGTGAFVLSSTDLRMPGFGVPFQDVRRYSSASATAGSLGVGWSWTYDVRVLPPAGDETAVTVRAEDGARVTYRRAADGSYDRPPAVRSDLSAVEGGGWKLVTPNRITYRFDATGRLTSVKSSRDLGVTLAYGASSWTITDAAGRVVTVRLQSDGLVKSVALPDGRTVGYAYAGGRLGSVTDATGAVWRYTYDADGLLAKVYDPKGRVQLTNAYGGGRVVRQTDITGAVTSFSWDPGKHESTTTDPDGVKYFDGYRGNILIYSQNGNGDTVNQRYDTSVNPDLLVDAKGSQYVQAYDRSGNVTSATQPEPFNATATNTYDAHNNLTSHTDALGNKAVFGYTAFDELATVTDPGENRTVFTVDDRGLVTALKDPRGKVTKMAYDAAGNLVARTTPLDEKSTYGYDRTGRLTSSTDPRGNLSGADATAFTTRFVYDNLDRLRKSYDPGKEDPWTTVYDELGQLTATGNPLGATTRYAYTEVLGRTASITDPNEHTSRYTYTAAGRQASVTDGAGDKTTYTYNNRGNLATVVSPRGNVSGANKAQFTSTYIYDFNANVVRVSHPYPGGGFVTDDARFDELNRQTADIDELGKSTTTSYDNNSNVVSTVDPLGQSTSISYDINNRPSAVTVPAGGQVTTEYDAAGNPVKRTAATGGVTTWTYDDDGRLASTVEPRGNADGASPAGYTTSYGYDAEGNLTKVTDPLGATTVFQYDAVNRVAGTVDAAGHSIRYKYDDADRQRSLSGPQDGAVTSYERDAAGHITSRTDPNEHVSRYTYDAVGRLDSATDPLGRRTAYTYDAENNLTRTLTPGSADATSRTIANSYDILGRQTGQDLAGGQTIYAYNYDAKNRLTSLADPGGLSTRSYDNADRLTAVKRGEDTFSYGYDADGNITLRTWPDGTVVDADYDASDRMTGLVTHGGTAGTGRAAYSFGYDPSGRLTRTTGPESGGLVTDRGYDRAGRLSDLNSHNTAGTVARFRIDHDAVGNPTSISTTRGAAEQTVAYTYDVANRVTGACYAASTCSGSPSGTVAYTYDKVGNRLTQKLTGSAGSGTVRYDYDKADQLTRAEDSATDTVTKYGYDDQGNLTRAGDSSFDYNLDHSLASATIDGLTTSYGYDGGGLRRTAVTDTGADVTSRTFTWDIAGDNPQLALERTAQSSNPDTGTARGYLSGPGETPLALLTGTSVNPFAPDWLAGVADVLSPEGDVLAAYDFDPYGVPRKNGTAASAVSGSKVDNPVRFAGGYQDAGLGGDYATPARVYAPSTGRFGGVDPVSPAVSNPAVSSYAYVDNRPTSFRDPSGAQGGNPDHDDAVRLAVSDRLNPLYGPQNVYGDVVPGQLTLPGHVGTGSGGRICVPTFQPQPGDPATSCPDIIVINGALTYLYEVKPASDQLSSIKPHLPVRGVANAAQVQRYISSLANAGFSNVQAGPPIVPASRSYADGSTLTIFSGNSWASLAPKGKRPAASSDGIIYYLKKNPPKKPTNPPTAPKPDQRAQKQDEEPKDQPADQPILGDTAKQVLAAVAAVAVVALVVVAVVVLAPAEIAAGVVGGLVALGAWAFG